jgi:N-acetylneuraminic acid mutarotase
MVIWGGTSDPAGDPLTDGAAFDPAARTWRKVSAAPLSPRFDAKALWTGREVVVFGGTSVAGDILVDGAAWDPASDGWRPIPVSPLGARDGAVVAWAGDRLVVWGGATVPPPAAAAPAAGDTPEPPSPEMRDDGSAYVPATDSWVPVAAAPIPARSGAESVWTGTRLVISGGYHEGDSDDRTDGAALDPVTGAWSPIAARPAPGSCGGDTPCDGVWTGAAALFPAPPLAYDPAGDRWSAVPAFPSADAPLTGAPTVWTGRELLAWGTAGDTPVDDSTAAAPPLPPTGGMYDPAANRWQTLPAGPLSGRVSHTAVWAGQEMLVWGGTAGDTGLADGAAFQPPG